MPRFTHRGDGADLRAGSRLALRAQRLRDTQAFIDEQLEARERRAIRDALHRRRITAKEAAARLRQLAGAAA